MTTWGGKLDGVDEEQLRQQLRTETDAKAVKRLTSALLYRQGKSPAEIEQLLGFPEQTVYTIGSTPSPSANQPRSATSLVPVNPLVSPTTNGQN
nr:helix-turn-helix domain-containing protein [Saliphagus sp. LR7]